MFFKDYNPVFPWKELQDIEIVDKDSMEIFCIVTIPPNEPQEMTVNLQAPVVINKNKLIAKQIIAINEYDIRHKLVS
jgi:flagellar assembly factor FliW